MLTVPKEPLSPEPLSCSVPVLRNACKLSSTRGEQLSLTLTAPSFVLSFPNLHPPQPRERSVVPSMHQNIWKGEESSPDFLSFAGARVCSQHQQCAVLGMCLEMCIQPCQCSCSGLCQILSDMAMLMAKPTRCVCSCWLGSELSWLPGRSGLAGSPGSAPSQESGMGHAAWGATRAGRAWVLQDGSPGSSLQLSPRCPTVCCGIFLHYTHPRLGWGLTQIWQPRNGEGFRPCCIPKLLMRMLQRGAPQTAGKGGAGQTMLPPREHGGGRLGWRVHSGKW